MGDRKTNAFSQDLFRNVKVYDYLIDFILQNKELYLEVRRINYDNLKPGQVDIVKNIRSVFRQTFRVLEEMVRDNAKTQELMWKYKEVFIFEELGDLETEGELEYTLAVINDSDNAVKFQQNKWTLTKTRNFVNLLNKRVGGKENFVLILEIYNKLIKFEAISFLKQSLTKMILKNTDDMHSYKFDTRREFEKALNIQELIYSIIQNQDMPYIREFLKEQFPLNSLFTEIEESIAKINEIELSHTEDYDEQDFEELRNYAYDALLNIYKELYLNIRYSETTKEELFDCFKVLGPKYINGLNRLNNEADFDENTGYKRSDVKFLMVHMQEFLRKFKKCVDNQQDRALSFRKQNLKAANTLNRSKVNSEDEDSDFSDDNKTQVYDPRKQLQYIENLTNEIFCSMESSDNEKVIDLIEEVQMKIEKQQDADTSVSKQPATRSLRDLKTMRVQVVGSANDTTNLRSQLSFHYSLVWKSYVDTIINSRDSRRIIDNEHLELANLIFNTLTDSKSNPLVVQSFKTFISTSIDYVYSCEKANWTLFIIVFIFKINSMILKKCDQEMSSDISDFTRNHIEENILDTIDTLRTSSMIFKILSTSKDDAF